MIFKHINALFKYGSSTNLFFMESELSKCTICFESYDETGSHSKMVLPCGHHLCRECFNGFDIILENDKIMVRCHYCRLNCDVFSEVIRHIESEEDLVKFFSKISQNKEDVKPCDKCNANCTNVGCQECGIKLCDKCWDQIHCIGKLLDHARIPINEICHDFKCKLHPNYIRDIVCSDTGELICMMCERSKIQNDHPTELLYDIAPKYKQNIKDAMSKLDERMNKVCKIISNINNFITNYSDNNMEDVISKICDECEKARQKITMMQEEKIREVELLAKEQETDLSKRNETLIEYAIGLSQITKESSNLLGLENEFLLVSNYNNFNAKFNGLMNNHPDIEDPYFKKIDFVSEINILDDDIIVGQSPLEFQKLAQKEINTPRAEIVVLPGPFLFEQNDIFDVPLTGKITVIMVGAGASIDLSRGRGNYIRGYGGQIVIKQLDVTAGEKIRVYIGQSSKSLSLCPGGSTFFKSYEAKGGVNGIKHDNMGDMTILEKFNITFKDNLGLTVPSSIRVFPNEQNISQSQRCYGRGGYAEYTEYLLNWKFIIKGNGFYNGRFYNDWKDIFGSDGCAIVIYESVQ